MQFVSHIMRPGYGVFKYMYRPLLNSLINVYYNTHRYFASCLVFRKNTSSEPNVGMDKGFIIPLLHHFLVFWLLHECTERESCMYRLYNKVHASDENNTDQIIQNEISFI